MLCEQLHTGTVEAAREIGDGLRRMCQSFAILGGGRRGEDLGRVDWVYSDGSHIYE